MHKTRFMVVGEEGDLCSVWVLRDRLLSPPPDRKKTVVLLRKKDLLLSLRNQTFLPYSLSPSIVPCPISGDLRVSGKSLSFSLSVAFLSLSPPASLSQACISCPVSLSLAPSVDAVCFVDGSPVLSGHLLRVCAVWICRR